MSYDKVKSIGIRNNKVFITSACSNIRPLSYNRYECEYLSKKLQDEGKESVIKKILMDYWSGNFHQTGSENNYSKTVILFNYENPDIYWGNVGTKGKMSYNDKPYEYDYSEVKEKLYQRYLKYIKRDKSLSYVIMRSNIGDYVKQRKRSVYTTGNINNATKYTKEDAILLTLSYYTTKFEIVKIN